MMRLARLSCQSVVGRPVVDCGKRPTAAGIAVSSGITSTSGTSTPSLTGGAPGMAVRGCPTVTVVCEVSQSTADSGSSWACAGQAARAMKRAGLFSLKYDVLTNLFRRRGEIDPEKRAKIGKGHECNESESRKIDQPFD